jgi:hypothetical protein
MFLVHTPEYQNGLTEMLGNPKKPCTFEDVLCHSELGATVQNDSDLFFKWLADQDPGRKDKGSRIYTLCEWALTTIHNTPELDARFKVRQLNRNAAHILSRPFQRLSNHISALWSQGDRWVINTVLSFPGSEFRDDPTFSAHFSSILLHFLRTSSVTDEWFPPEDRNHLIDLCLDRVDVLAYSVLLGSLIPGKRSNVST